MKCDLHLHTIHSGMCTVPVARAFCRESYNEPGAVYDKLKRLGMELVTVTDHDSIDACEELRRYPDFFLSEEVTVTLPSGTEAHLAVYDISERDHEIIQKLRNDFQSLIVYLQERRLLYGINHVFSALTGDRHLEDFAVFARLVPCMEVRNAAMSRRANAYSAELASRLRKTPTAGSDAHTLRGVGSAWTEVTGARSKREFLDGLRSGHGLARGTDGSYYRLTRDVISICSSMMSETPWTRVLCPFISLIPVITLVNCWLESAFADRWFGRVTHRDDVPLAASLSGEMSA
jgi:predicted metal-dependent phosphoesterase TrpH